MMKKEKLYVKVVFHITSFTFDLILLPNFRTHVYMRRCVLMKIRCFIIERSLTEYISVGSNSLLLLIVSTSTVVILLIQVYPKRIHFPFSKKRVQTVQRVSRWK